MMRTNGNDRGAVRLVTVTRLVVVLAIIGVFGYDVFSVMSSRIGTENDAQTAAFAASQAYHDDSNNLPDAYAAAVNSLAGKGETVLTKDFTVDTDGTIHLLVQSTAHTIVLSHVGPLRHFTQVTEHGDANSIN
jgi:hypothetical protein